MQSEELKALLAENFPDAEIAIQIDGSHFLIDIVCETFEGLRPLKRQQMIYQLIQDKIADGSMHAIHMNLHTPAQRVAANKKPS